jgi:hypothetical protein
MEKRAEDLDFEGVNCYDAAQAGFTGIIRAGNPNFSREYTTDDLLDDHCRARRAVGPPERPLNIVKNNPTK